MPLSLPPSPGNFILLDDARAEGAGARLYRDPVGEIVAQTPAEIPAALDALRAATGKGFHAAGYLHYEAGHALEPKLAPLTAKADDAPLLWFGLFDHCQHIPPGEVATLLPAPDPEAHGVARPLIDATQHRAALDQVLNYIRAGDIYQANLTLAATVPMPGDPLAAYAAIRPRAAMGHGALIRQDGRHMLCFSPESFFEIMDGHITALPMKGTAPRHVDAAEDAAAIADLRTDPKQRAENLMIVDLIRNDLSRVCEPGSVRVPDIFTVETYPTVHQMTSRVIGRLSPGIGPVDALEVLFPCGSITGAPKIRAMQIIAELERHHRGLYTGTIGSIDPDGNARFNVAIRTISVEKDATQGVMGIGSGIVADSKADAEWNECLDKARFLETPTGSRMQGFEG